MKKLILTAVLFFPILLFAQTGEKNFIDQNYIEVTGKAELEVVPDMIYIHIVVNEKDNSGKTPIEELEKKMKTKLQELGIDISKDLAVEDLESNFKYYLLFKPDVMISKEFQLMVRDAKIAGSVFIELKKLGISNLSIAKLDHSKMEELKKEVKVKAIKAAKTKAELLTQAIGQNIGRAIYIQEIEYGDYQPMMMNTRMNKMSVMDLANTSEPSEPSVDFQKIKLSSTIAVKFELK
jgi:uncharacterized protein YggE